MKNRKITVLLAFVLASMTHAAAPPADIESSMTMLKPHRSEMVDGVVQLEFLRLARVSIADMRSTAFRVLCHRVIMNPKKAWKSDKVKGIEMWNDGKFSGFALMVTAADCLEIDRASDKDRQKQLDAKTWICRASNPCRPRLPGERTSMDD